MTLPSHGNYSSLVFGVLLNVSRLRLVSFMFLDQEHLYTRFFFKETQMN